MLERAAQACHLSACVGALFYRHCPSPEKLASHSFCKDLKGFRRILILFHFTLRCSSITSEFAGLLTSENETGNVGETAQTRARPLRDLKTNKRILKWICGRALVKNRVATFCPSWRRTIGGLANLNKKYIVVIKMWCLKKHVLLFQGCTKLTEEASFLTVASTVKSRILPPCLRENGALQ